MATLEEQQQLIEALKFTPRTYTISMWGYGGEKVMGTVDRVVFDYFKHRRLDLSEFAWGYDYAEDNNIPEDMHPFPPGSWYECDNLAHVSGVSREAGTVQISDENGKTVFEKSLSDCDGCDDSPEWCCNDEAWVGMCDVGKVVFVGNSNEKGTFFEGEIYLCEPFDIEKLELHYDEVDGEEIVNCAYYDGEEIENNGGGTNGKSSDFGFFLIHPDHKWEKYSNMSDIKYKMTTWFPKKINPVRQGLYLIKTAGKNSYEYQCQWTGTKWVGSYVEPENFDTADEVKIKEWQGLAANPDGTVVEWNPVAELDKIVAEFEAQVGIHETGTDDPVDFPNTGWPFGPANTTKET